MSPPENWPSCLADYEILDELSHDGPAIVYRARQVSLDREVVLHLVRLADLGNLSEAERLLRGARAASQLDHPALVRVYDVGEGDGYGYVTTGQISGPTLAELVAKGRLLLKRL